MDKASLTPKVESQVRHLLAQLTSMIAKAMPNVRTEEIRQFIRKHQNVGDFRSLALTLILLAESEPHNDCI